MRTDAEILARVREIQAEDFFGFEISDLLIRLPFAAAREFLKADATEDGWTVAPRGRDALLAEMDHYAEFAWGKARDHRGISANRSVSHYRGWLWLLSDDDFGAIDWERYRNYGAPILKQICERFAFPVPADEALLRMSRGEPCEPGCGEGCGR